MKGCTCYLWFGFLLSPHSSPPPRSVTLLSTSILGSKDAQRARLLYVHSHASASSAIPLSRASVLSWYAAACVTRTSIAVTTSHNVNSKTLTRTGKSWQAVMSEDEATASQCAHTLQRSGVGSVYLKHFVLLSWLIYIKLNIRFCFCILKLF